MSIQTMQVLQAPTPTKIIKLTSALGNKDSGTGELAPNHQHPANPIPPLLQESVSVAVCQFGSSHVFEGERFNCTSSSEILYQKEQTVLQKFQQAKIKMQVLQYRLLYRSGWSQILPRYQKEKGTLQMYKMLCHETWWQRYLHTWTAEIQVQGM